ncbi:MAG: prepilin-type N-terminal cleavage/methylation domain-containing protein [Bdellovibrionaceae bacterium]|nr:prepilin-type N-terminal cleavage/methylation domain-containing protein [Pseudobdellovibrionaceae bacterium]
MRAKGFSLVEIIAALGILSVVLVAISWIVANVGKSQIFISEKAVATEFISGISKHLNSQAGCTSSIVNLSLPTSTFTNVTIDNYIGYGAASPMSLTNGVQLSSKLRVESIEIRDKGIAPYDTTVNGVSYRRLMAQIKISMSVNMDPGSTPIERIIEIPVLTRLTPSASGTIDMCGLEASTGEICTAMGGTAGPDTCTPTSVCHFKGVAYGCWPYTDCVGASFPSATHFTLASEAQSVNPPNSICTRGGVPTSTGQGSYTFISGPCDKYGNCTTYPNTTYFYICLQCS